MKHLLPIALIALAPTFGAAQQPTRPRIEPSVIAPNASTFTLPNGVQVVVLPDRRVPLVTHAIWYRVGSADEPPGFGGVAHFLEHLLFKGTERYPGNSFSQALIASGGVQNATTSWDTTRYYQRTNRAQLATLMDYEADRMMNIRITPPMVASERDVVREERFTRIENNPTAQLHEQMYAALFQAHPYRLPVIGWMHDVDALNEAQIRVIYERFYTPGNAVVVVEGDVNAEEVREIAERTYGRLAQRPPVTAQPRPPEPPPVAARRVALAHPLVQQPAWLRFYLTPPMRSTEGQVPEALSVLTEILGGSAGRLYRRLVVEQGLATSVDIGTNHFNRDHGTFIISASPRPGVSFEQLEAAIDALIGDLVRTGITQAELDRAINAELASAIIAQDSIGGIGDIFGNAMMAGMSFEEVRQIPFRIARVTTDSINAAARTYLDPRRAVTGTLAPAR